MINSQKLDKGNIQDILALAPLQEGILFHYIDNPDSEQYLEQLSLTLSGNVNTTVIKQAWDFVMSNNEMLRTVFRWNKLDKPVQIVLKTYSTPFVEHDLSNEVYSQRDILLNRIKKQNLDYKMDISSEPLRIIMVKLESNKYELIIMYHHILYDGWSNSIIIKEFLEAYDVLLKGEVPTKLEKNKFKEFIKWCNTQDKNNQREYWEKYFARYENQTSLNIGGYSHNIDSSNIVEYKLEDEFYFKISSFCKNQRITLAAVLNTAWGIILQKYKNTSDVIFGTTVSGRNAKVQGIEKIVGLFINTLPLRINTDDDKSLIEILKEVDIMLKERDEYQNTPLVDIKEYSGLNNTENIFDTLVVVENYPLDKMIMQESSIKIEEYKIVEMTNYILTLTAVNFEGLELKLSYDKTVINSDSINRMIRHFINIIKGIVNSPHISLGNLDMLTEEERHQIIVDFNNTCTDYPREKTINKLFEEEVEKNPNKIAVEYQDYKLTYKDLNEKSNQLARRLKACGVVREQLVGIMVDKSIEMVIAILAILKAGGAYLPIDTTYPQERIEYMLNDSNSKILITQANLLSNIDFGIELILLDDKSIYTEDIENIITLNKPTDLAYAIYTSGSTGKPKGTLIEHKSVIRLVKNTNYIDFKEDDKILQTGSIVFDAITFELWGALLNGLTLYLADNENIIYADKLKKIIDINRVTTIWLTSSLFNQIVEQNPFVFEKCRNLLVGGDVVSPKHINAVKKINSRLRIINGYGPTENTTFTACLNIEDEYNGSIPIGSPISNTRIYILDRYNNIQPIGITGELCTSGDGLARGYINRPQLTAERFVDNPIEPNTKMYRTGDLARWLPDGNIEFLGRMDYQVKIRGFRIELGEVESKLLRHENIKEAIVTIMDSNTGDKYLWAFYVSTKELTLAELRQHMLEELPDYMIPTYFSKLDKFPLTPNGKVDRTALVEIGNYTLLDGKQTTIFEYEAPRTVLEEKLWNIWRQVLKINEIGINNNFFELGGHSLKATGLVAKIHKELNVEIPLKEIFKSPTIKEMAEYINKTRVNIYSTIEPTENREFYELSSAQKRIYTLQQFDKYGTNYNMPILIELEGKLDVERFESTFNQLIHRHESLRTSFQLVGEELVQKIHDKVNFQIEYINNKKLLNKTIEALIKDFISPFDLSKAPLLRVCTLDLSSNKYILMIDMHHIISDGTSMGILVDEFMSLYEGKELSTLRLQYKDYAVWQNKLEKQLDSCSKYNSEINKMYCSQEEYWLKQFQDEIPVLNMPTDYPRPQLQSFEGANIDFELDQETTKALKNIARDTGSTLYMVLLAMFNILLSIYSGQEDIVVGSPIAGRYYADLESIIGMFVNTLAMRNYSEGQRTFIEFLTGVKENGLKAYENQNYQFENLVQMLNIPRDISRNPIFDVMFSMQNIDIQELSITGLKLKSCGAVRNIAKFDLTLEALEHEKSLKLSMQYCTKLYSNVTIQRLCKHFEGIVKTIVGNSEVKLKDIQIITEQERYQILTSFNDTQKSYPKYKTLNQLFEEQTERTPDNLAIIFEDEKITYRELNEKSNQIARILRYKGIVSDQLIGIMSDKSIEMLIGILGILKSGGAYVPIDPEYPQERIEFILHDSNAAILLTGCQKLQYIKFHGEIIDLNNKDLYNTDSSKVETINKSNDLAYVIYTSGSTGTPKGVLIEHRNAVNVIYSQMCKYGICENDNVLQFSSICFDASVEQIFITILSGATLVILNKESLLNMDKFEACIVKHKITHINAVPAFLNNIPLNNSYTIKRIISGGDTCPRSLVEKWYKQCDFYNVYGPTEATITSTSFLVKGVESKTLIGKPVSNTRIYILDKYNNIQPIGVAGEICIGGDGIARGYLNRPELTSEKFIDNPYEPSSETGAARMYRTGDLARWQSDGNIEFLGRLDYQVKVRGYRIELGEIENKLLNHIDIKEALVTVTNNEGDKYLCAYYVSTKNIEATEFRVHLAKELPDYMIPTYFIRLDTLPVTANGKIDRKSLPIPDFNMAVGVQYEAPCSELEEKLVNIWEQILRVDRLGINDNFFELGGHSLKAATLVARLHKELSIEVPLKEVFKAPTIKGLSQYIKGIRQSIYSAIQPAELKEYYEVSSAQKRIYTLQQFDLKNTSYNMPILMEIEGELNIENFEMAFIKLIERHEALRTSFKHIDEEIVQIIHDKVDFNIEYEENILKVDTKEFINSFIIPFDLTKAPLLRVKLLKLYNEKANISKYIFALDMHHIISDGTSMGLLVDEFIKLYEKRDLPKLKLQYKDYAVWQNQLHKQNEYCLQESYWLKQFADEVPVLNMPTDYPRPAIQSFEGDCIDFEFDEELTRGIKRVAKENGSTPYMVMLGALNILLSKYSGQEDVTVGSPVAGRAHADLHNIIGMFINTLAMRNLPQGSKTIREFLLEVKENALKAYENQEYQFEELVDRLAIHRDMSRNPLFDVVFVMQNIEMREINIENLVFNKSKAKTKISKFDITLEAMEQDEKLYLSLQYCSRLYRKETIVKIAEHFKNINEFIIYNLDKKLYESSITTEEEASMLIVDFNNTNTDYPRDKTIHELFEIQVQKTPNKVAAVYKDEELTYKELNEKSNQLAKVIRQKGILPDEMVGIMVDKSVEMVIGILAILKAGGAYLPIDTDYPTDRIKYMLEDSRARIILTQRQFTNTLVFSGEIIELNDNELYVGDSDNLQGINKPNHLAYVIYTSGSTGNPKGVMIEHKSVVRLVKNTNYIEFKEDDRILQTGAIVFDAITFELWGSLLNGLTLYLVEKDKVINADKLKDEIEKNNITTIWLTSSLFNQIVDQNPTVFDTCRNLLVGGDVLSSKHINQIRSANRNIRIINGYGPTENTTFTTCLTIDNEYNTDTPIPIGSPISNTRVYILDKHNNIMPIGVPGELCTSGDGLARGYLNRPELTEEKFVLNPFEDKQRMYRTGDLVKWMPDGNIEFLGRIDHQVKLRGYRIELGEIESKLLGHKNINEAIVLVQNNSMGEKYICAYYVCQNTTENELTISEIREYLSNELPEYMIPAFLIQLDKMPLTTNGKVDRRVLPQPDFTTLSSTEYEAPTNQIEETLVRIWQDVLKIDRIGINDNFFELGGHSLKATTLTAKIYKELNVEVPLKVIFKALTIKKLSEHIATADYKDFKQIKVQEPKEYYDVSSSQNRLLILNQINEDDTSYNMLQTLEITGQIDNIRVKEIFDILIKRHEALRTSFEYINGIAVQKIHKNITFNIDYVNAVEKDIEKQIKGFIKPFDLTKAPLMRLAFIEISKDKHIMLLDMHHIISDGFSIGIITNEFMKLYKGEKLSEIKVQYKDYAAWHNELLQSDVIKQQGIYWTNKLNNFIYTELPKKNTIAINKSEGIIKELILSKEITAGIETYCRRRNITRFVFMLGVFKLILMKHIGQNDLTIGIPDAGRSFDDLDKVVGLFLNVLVLRTDVKTDVSFKEYLDLLNTNIIEARDNKEYPYDQLYSQIRETHSRNITSIFSILFNYVPPEEEVFDLGTIKLKPYRLNGISPKYDITLYIKEADEMLITLVYKSELYDENYIETILYNYSILLDKLIKNEEVIIKDIEFDAVQNNTNEVSDAADWDEYFDNDDFI